MDSLYRLSRMLLAGLALALLWPAVALAAPSNDSSQAAWLMGLNTSVENHGNTDATLETGERTACGTRSYGATVWYGFDIASQGRVVVTVTGTSSLGGAFDSVISFGGDGDG